VNVFPTIVFADFEAAIHNAVTTVWPGLEVKVCRFHLGRNWWRKMQSLGLCKQYGKKDSEVGQFLKSATALRWNFYPIFRTTSEWNSFATACCSCLSVDADSTFPLPVWSECTVSSLRTINACELFHAHFKCTILQCAS